MEPWARTLGRTGVKVSAITAGTSALGGRVPHSVARETLQYIASSPILSIDTANEYADGESEQLIGEIVNSGVAERLTILSKVDRAAQGVFSAERVRASLKESLRRLRIERLPLVFLHDPHKMLVRTGDSLIQAITEPGGPLDGLVALRDEGVIDAIGLAGGSTPLMIELMSTGLFDACLTHNRYTLVDRSADRLLDMARGMNAGVLNAAVFGGKILAQGADRTNIYAYREAPPTVLNAIREMEALCSSFEVPLAAAALQFSLRDARIDTTVVGLSTAQQVKDTLRLSAIPIPDALWPQLEELRPPPAYWIDAPSG